MAVVPSIALAAQVTFQWEADPEPYVAGYRLFARHDGQSYDYTHTSWEGSGNVCTLELGNDSQIYYFVIHSYDAQGNESADSNEVAFRYDPNPPQAPQALAPKNNGEGISIEPDLETGAFADADSTDTHASTRWQIFRGGDDICVFDVVSEADLTITTVPPLVLEGSTSYYWTAQFYNQFGSISKPAPNASFKTEPWAVDDNGNGIPDSQEVVEETDLDGNGQPDAEQKDLKLCMSIDGSQMIGVNQATWGSGDQLQAVQSIDAAGVSGPSISQENFPAGLVKFKIVIDEPGASRTVNVFLSNPMPEKSHWVMFDPAKGYVDDTANSTVSTERRLVTLGVQDGGSGDLDGVANGIIVGMGGYTGLSKDDPVDDTAAPPASAPAAPASGGGGGGGGCFIGTLF